MAEGAANRPAGPGSTAAGAAAEVRLQTFDTAGGHRFGRATLAAPATLNALTLPMVDALDAALVDWAADPQVAGVMLDGDGSKAFCAGGDVVGLYRAIVAARAAVPDAPAGDRRRLPPEAAAFFEREYRLDYRIHRFPKPLLCWGHGIVMGGGIGLFAGASHRVATPRSRFAMPEIGIGLFPDVGGSWVLPRLRGRTGLFLALTGAPLNGADARTAGLADVVLRDEDRDAVVAAIAAARWRGDGNGDRALLGDLLAGFAADVELPASPLATHAALVDDLIDDGPVAAQAGRIAALAGHEDRWLAQAGTTFVRGSPTSAVLGVELQRRAGPGSLADAFRLEWQAATGCCIHDDFAEGVRALLVDKDRQPRWRPDRLEAVTPAWIDAHLAARHKGPHPLADLG